MSQWFYLVHISTANIVIAQLLSGSSLQVRELSVPSCRPGSCDAVCCWQTMAKSGSVKWSGGVTSNSFLPR